MTNWTNCEPKLDSCFKEVPYDSMTIRENLEFPLRRHTRSLGLKDTTPLVMEALENVGLAHTIDLMPEELSGGMKHDIALARTLILMPKIILYDEPTTGLDPITGKEIILLMQSIKKNTTPRPSSSPMTWIVRPGHFQQNDTVGGRHQLCRRHFQGINCGKRPKVQAFFK